MTHYIINACNSLARPATPPTHARHCFTLTRERERERERERGEVREGKREGRGSGEGEGDKRYFFPQ